LTDLAIDVHDLRKTYRTPFARRKVEAVRGVTFGVERGHIFGFVGPNGAGKTTTIRMLMGLIRPSGGSATLLGHPLGSRAARFKIGFLPESPYFYDYLTVRELCDLAGRLFGMPHAARTRRADELIDKVGLGGARGLSLKKFSKGMLQRAGLAQALMNDPELVVLDEPMSGLDPNQAVEIRDLIKNIGRERTVVLSTHNLAEVQAACSRVLIISKGKIVADDTPDGLRDRAGKSRYVVGLLDKGNGQSEKSEALLRGLPGVERVKKLDADPGELRFEALPKGGEDLRPLLFKAAVDNGLTLVGLSREGQGLEQIFRELTTSDDGAGGKQAARAS
jgi:ABC-2 type transport system ATP-binding protein